MPNWCWNELTVSGTPTEIKRFVDATIGLPAEYPPAEYEQERKTKQRSEPLEPQFCFNALVPTPAEVLQIGFDGHGKIPEENQTLAMLGRTVLPLDGYHWNIANWGTKWDVYGDGITAAEMGWKPGADSLFIGFDTAWSPPIAWMEKVAERFTELQFKLHYEEPGCFFAGDLYAENGEHWLDEYDDARCHELFNYEQEEAED